MRLNNIFSLFFVPALALLCGCAQKEATAPDRDRISSASYKGHESDQDANNFVNAYPAALGTRLDDCKLCHANGTVATSKGTSIVNACDNCHSLMRDSTVADPYARSLNAFGAAYKNAGRDKEAFAAIKNMDSDGDGHLNDAEIFADRFPGDSASKPGQPVAAAVVKTMAELKAMPPHRQFLLCNASKQEFDDYATYKGVRIAGLITALNIDTNGLTGVTVFAPDGFQKSFTKEKIYTQYDSSIYYSGLDEAGLGADRGFVNYPDTMPDVLTDGQTIPDAQWLMLAYARDFMPMSISYIDSATWSIEGEGPYRIVVPQDSATEPDRGLNYGKGDKYDWKDVDHNAGAMVRGVTVIRLDPMPAGYEEFDYMNGGWGLVEAAKIVVYGHGIQ